MKIVNNKKNQTHTHTKKQDIITKIVNRSEDDTIRSKDLPVEILPWLPFLSFSHVQQGSQTPLLQ